MILVVGSTGLLGQEVCQQLALQHRSTRALVRPTTDPAKVEKLQHLGITCAPGDLRDASSIQDALLGIDTVVCTASAMPFAYRAGSNDIRSIDLEGVMRLVDLARAAGVRQFIYTSFSGNLEVASPLRDAKRAVERHLRASGMGYTILRPSYFMEVWLSAATGFDVAGRRATIYGAGDRRITWISLRDVAQFAVAAIGHPAAHNATLELGGPEPLTPLEVVALFETALHVRFTLHHALASALHLRMAAATDPMEKSFVALMIGVVHGDWIPMAGLLRQFPIKLTTVHEFAAAQALQPVAR